MRIADQRAAPTRNIFSVGVWFRRVGRLPLISLVVLSVLLTSALMADVIAPFDPLETNLPLRLQPPVFVGGSWIYPLGTDELGRDILSRIIFGARIALVVSGLALVLGALVGTIIGVVSGYFGGKLDMFLMRVTDLTLSYPMILVALLLSVTFGPRTSNVVIAIALILWARFARVVRGETLAVREQGYVALARIAGASPMRIILRHIVPNIANTIMVLASLQSGWAILVEASLSFLGAGVPPPEPAWGSMVALGREYVTTAWWVPTMPGFAIMFAVLALNLLGDWLRDTLDPKLRQI